MLFLPPARGQIIRPLKTAMLAPRVASLPLRLEVYNGALVRPTFYPCLAAGKLSKEVEGEPLPSFLPSFLMAPLTRKIGKSRLPRLRQSRET